MRASNNLCTSPQERSLTTDVNAQSATKSQSNVVADPPSSHESKVIVGTLATALLLIAFLIYRRRHEAQQMLVGLAFAVASMTVAVVASWSVAIPIILAADGAEIPVTTPLRGYVTIGSIVATVAAVFTYRDLHKARGGSGSGGNSGTGG